MDKKMSAYGGKKQNLLLAGGLFFAVVFLGGCGAQDKGVAPQTSGVSNPAGGTGASKVPVTLPDTVSSQPGANVDEEVKNIDNDLKAIDDNSLNQGLSDKDLGV